MTLKGYLTSKYQEIFNQVLVVLGYKSEIVTEHYELEDGERKNAQTKISSFYGGGCGFCYFTYDRRDKEGKEIIDDSTTIIEAIESIKQRITFELPKTLRKELEDEGAPIGAILGQDLSINRTIYKFVYEWLKENYNIKDLTLKCVYD